MRKKSAPKLLDRLGTPTPTLWKISKLKLHFFQERPLQTKLEISEKGFVCIIFQEEYFFLNKLDQETWLCRTHLGICLVKLLTILHHIRPYHIIFNLLDLFEPIWINLTCLDVFGPIFTHLYQFAPLGTHLNSFSPYGAIWSHLEPIGPFWTNLDPIGAIESHFELFGSSWSHSELLDPAEAILEPFGAIFI